MSVQLEIIRAAEFIRFGTKGEFDLVASCATLHSLAEACERRGMNRALLDGRNARAELSPNELAALVNAFVEIGFTKGSPPQGDSPRRRTLSARAVVRLHQPDQRLERAGLWRF